MQTTSATIIADASFCPKTHAAGFGFWARSNRGSLAGTGCFKDRVIDIQAAEAAAIVNAIYASISRGVVARGDSILVQTDSKGAPRALLRSFKKKSTLLRYRRVAEVYQRIVQENDLKVNFRYVRGHTKIKVPRYTSQRLCDKDARGKMREMRKRLLESEPSIAVKFDNG